MTAQRRGDPVARSWGGSRLRHRSSLLDLDAFGLGVVHPAPHGDLQQAVIEAGGDLAPVYAFGQLYPPPEVPEVTLPRVVFGRFGLALALPVDDKRPSGERDIHVVSLHAGEFAAYYQVVAHREYVGGRHPGGRVGPAPLLLAAAPLGVLAHPGHLAHGVHDPPEGVPCPAHFPSFWPVLVIATGSTLSTGLRSLKILGYGRPHPAHRAPGHEDRPALHLARLVLVCEPEFAHLSEGHQLPALGARPAKDHVLADPGMRQTPLFHAQNTSTPI